MAFSEDLKEFHVLIEPWRILSDRGLTGSFVAVFALAVLSECIKYYNIYRTYDPSQTERNAVSANGRLVFHVVGTMLSMVQNTLVYFVMLVAMTYNVWLFVAIILGAGTAHLVFTPLLERYMYQKDYVNQHRYYEPVTAT